MRITALTVATLMVSQWPVSSPAGDRSFDCATPGGGFTIAEGENGLELYEGDKKRDHELVREVTIRKREGLCTTGEGDQHAWETHDYLLEIRTVIDGRKVPLLFLCELASSGIPASVSECTETVTHDKRLKAAYEQNTPAPESGAFEKEIQASYATRKNACGKGADTKVEIGDGRIAGPGFDCSVSDAKPAGTGLVAYAATCTVDGKKSSEGIALDLGNYEDHFELSLPGRPDWLKLFPCTPVPGLK